MFLALLVTLSTTSGLPYWRQRSKDVLELDNVVVEPGRYTIQFAEAGWSHDYYITYRKTFLKSLGQAGVVASVSYIVAIQLECFLVMVTGGTALIVAGAVAVYFMFAKHVLELSRHDPTVFIVDAIEGATNGTFLLKTEIPFEDEPAKYLFVNGRRHVHEQPSQAVQVVAKPSPTYPSDRSSVYLRFMPKEKPHKWLRAEHPLLVGGRAIGLRKYRMTEWRLNRLDD